MKYFYMDTSCSPTDLPSPLRNHGNFKITLQELRAETKRSWKHFSLANWHAVFVFMSFNFNTDNLLSETLCQSGSSESCLDTVEEGSRDFMGAPPSSQPLTRKAIFLYESYSIWEVGCFGKEDDLSLVKWNCCFPTVTYSTHVHQCLWEHLCEWL